MSPTGTPVHVTPSTSPTFPSLPSLTTNSLYYEPETVPSGVFYRTYYLSLLFQSTELKYIWFWMALSIIAFVSVYRIINIKKQRAAVAGTWPARAHADGNIHGHTGVHGLSPGSTPKAQICSPSHLGARVDPGWKQAMAQVIQVLVSRVGDQGCTLAYGLWAGPAPALAGICSISY